MPDEYSQQTFLMDLDTEIGWEWRWMKHNRRLYVGSNWATWIVRFLLLGLTTYQLQAGKNIFDQSLIILSAAILATLNIALPLLSITLKFQQRLEVHDQNAREYTTVRTELLAHIITLDEAIKRFTRTYKTSTETKIRRTP